MSVTTGHGPGEPKESHVRRSMMLAAALLSLTAPALAQSAGQTVDVGGWKVTRMHNPDGGFKQCSATMTYDDKSILAFAVAASKKVYVVIIEPDLKLTEGQVYKAKYNLDKKAAVSADAVATDATTLVIPIENDDAFMEGAMAGNTLTIKAGGEAVEEPLAGSKDAITQLAACALAAFKGE